jgi:hypothetical protein
MENMVHKGVQGKPLTHVMPPGCIQSSALFDGSRNRKDSYDDPGVT